MDNSVIGKNNYRLNNLITQIGSLKSKGKSINSIIDSLATDYSLKDILECLAGNKLIVKTIIVENIVVVNPINFKETDGVTFLKDYIKSMNS